MNNIIFILLICFLGNACVQKDKKLPGTSGNFKWTQDSIKKYFKENIARGKPYEKAHSGDSLHSFEIFSKYVLGDIKAKNISDPFILAFEEDYIDTVMINPEKQWFRITVDPCFRIPYCLILEKTNNKSILTLKMTDGYGGYYSGYLNFVSSLQDSDSLYNSISSRLHQLDFWKINNDTTCTGGFDGETWTFEGIENGQYNIISRWVPLDCGNDITRQLALIGVDLRNKAGFKNYMQVKTGMTKDEIEESFPEK